MKSPQGEAIPVTVICGFLGAGKTTLLKRVLEDPRGVRFGVLVNDFGAINIDAALIVETGADQVSLANGCICCSIQDDLVEAIERILQADPRPDRLVIEASGVSRPLSILAVLERPEFEGRLMTDATVCLVDADQFPALDFASTELAFDQAGSSDLLILNKCDIAAPADLAATESALLGPHPNTRRIKAAFAEVPYEVLFGIDRIDASRFRTPHAHQCGHDCDHDHDHHHHHRSRRRVRGLVMVDRSAPWSFQSCGRGFDSCRRSLLRAKGILRVRDDNVERREVFHLVGKRSSLVIETGAAPAVSQLVAIGRKGELDGAQLTAMIEAAIS